MNKPRIIAIIPARMASTRFPGKPLAALAGLPMIEHVRRRVMLSPAIDDALVATCDQEIIDAVHSFGGRAVMTSNGHERCTDRVAEAAQAEAADIVVNVQGDEPLLQPQMLEVLVAPMLKDSSLPCTNLISEITEAEAANPNLVKVVCNLQKEALYFSREPIPSRKKAGSLPLRWFKQLGIIAFRRDFLTTYQQLPPTPLEAIESVDMMRLVEHGYRISMVPVEFTGIGVDTPEDLAQATRLMRQDPWLSRYQS